MKAWYFSRKDRRLRFDDNREIKLGETHEVEGPPVLCERGLHASTDILAAIMYAPGEVIYRVELSGEIVKGDDKCAATKRTYLSGGIDISDVLRKFARMCALDVIHLWDAPDVVVQFLKTGDEDLRFVAWSEAAAAADAAALAAANAAANAARAAAAAAAQAALAAAHAARAATSTAAVRADTLKKQSRRLERMVRKAIKEAEE